MVHTGVAPAFARAWRNPHKAAALVYSGLGVLVISLTFAAGLVPPTREDAIWQLIIGAIFVLLFAALIWRGWWVLSAFLVASNLWRAVNYFAQGIGLHLELRALSITGVEPMPAAFVNAALMAVIMLFLARSARIGHSDWRARRLTEREA